MATTVELVAEVNSTSNVQTYDMGAVTPPANSIITVFAAATATALGAITDTGGVLTWTERFANRATNTFVCYTAEVGGSPSSITIRYDCTGDAATGCNISAFVTTGYDTANPVPQAAASDTGGAGTTPTATFASARSTNSSTLGFIGNSTSPAGVTEPSGWTEVADVGHANPTAGHEAAFKDGGETNATVTWGSTSASAWRSMAIEIASATVNSGDLSSTGTGAATAAGASIASAAASSTGTSTAEAQGASVASAELNAIGVATAEAVGAEVTGGTIEAGAASSTGTATAEAEGASIVSADALSQGEATAEAVGEAIGGAEEEEAPAVGAGGGGWYGGKRRKRKALDDADMMILARLAVERILQDRAKRLH